VIELAVQTVPVCASCFDSASNTLNTIQLTGISHIKALGLGSVSRNAIESALCPVLVLQSYL
jgi:hypothetical protein